MTRIRYGVRSGASTPSPAAVDIWSTAVTATWETDPDLIAAVLPPPLEPTDEPHVRLTISTVDIPGMPTFGAGWFGVRARHGEVEGEYPLFMPMSSEQSVIGGREAYGEPKKLADIWVRRDGDAVEAGIERMGFTVCEVHGRITETRAPYEKSKRDFWFKVGPGAEVRSQPDLDALLVYGEKTETARVHEGIDGQVKLPDAPLDPIADLVIRRMIDINWTERTSTQVGRVIATVPAATIAPYLHQRYDDLTVLGAGT